MSNRKMFLFVGLLILGMILILCIQTWLGFIYTDYIYNGILPIGGVILQALWLYYGSKLILKRI